MAAIREANGKAWPDGRPKGGGPGPPLLLGSPILLPLPGVQKKIGAVTPIFLVVADVRLRSRPRDPKEADSTWRVVGPRPRTLRRPHWGGLARYGHHSAGLATSWQQPTLNPTGVRAARRGRLELRAWLATPMYAAQAPLGPCSLWATWPPLLLGSPSPWLGWAYKNTGAARLRCSVWWLEADSNCRPRDYETLALTT